MPPLLNLGYVLQPGTTSQTCAPEAHGTPLNSLPGHGTAPHGASAECCAAAAAGSRANSSLCGTLSGVSEVGTSGASDASLPLSGRPSPRQVRNLVATTLCDWVVELPSSHQMVSQPGPCHPCPRLRLAASHTGLGRQPPPASG